MIQPVAKPISAQEPEFDGVSSVAIAMAMTTGPADEGPITMDTISAESRIAEADGACEDEGMEVETTTSSPLLASGDRKWAIRFSANRLTTVVIGMRYFGDARLSAYFAARVAVRLGISFERIRLYYSATLPAVLQTPRAIPGLSHASDLGSVAAATAAVIEGMCDRVIEKRRAALTAEPVKPVSRLASIGPVHESQRGSVLEIARSAA